MPVDYTAYPFSSPAPQIKALNVAPIPDRIFEGMKQYENAARGFDTFGFERDAHAAFVVHRPADAQVAQVYRMPLDAKEGDSLERLTHFDIGSGRTVLSFIPLVADSWRGVERRGGSLMVMDQNGDESFQLWRYWEGGEGIPKRKGEHDNKPGKGRIERLTWRDDCRYSQVYVSTSQKLLTYSSNKENKKDRLVYIARLDDTSSASGDKFDIEAISVAAMPLPEKGTKGTAFWVTESISLNDRFLLVASAISSAHRPLYVVDLTGPLPAHPEKLVFPGATEAEDQTIYGPAVFSHDPTTPHLAYVLTNAYGDFTSLVAYDLEARAVVQHITAPLPNLNALRPISWDIQGPRVSSELVLFRANVQGWNNLYAVPLKEGGRWRGHVVEIRLEWEGGVFEYITNRANGRPYEVLMKLTSYRSSGRLVYLDLDGAFEEGKCKLDEEGLPYIVAKPTECILANPEEPSVRAVKPELLKFKSFDELEVPSIYYHPNDRKTAVPLVIGIHGGPEGQATVRYKTAIHGYMLNELGCAVMYPNVRGSSGYGKRYMAADDIEKREDSVKDIGALLDHISTTMKNEIDSSKIAVMGGSYGGYMVYACLVHYSSKLTCGLANFGIAHWPSFLENTAPHRRDMRRKEYGDESDPETRKMLERISPLNRAAEMAVPLSIAHGETDSRVTVDEAMSLYGIVSGQVHTELMVCEKEGHGFKQKSVIESTNAAKLRFLERFLFGQYDTKL